MKTEFIQTIGRGDQIECFIKVKDISSLYFYGSPGAWAYKAALSNQQIYDLTKEQYDLLKVRLGIK